jgi:hypothetical protein
MMIQSQNNIAKIRFITALISLLISTIAFYSADIINRDGIFYMDMASAYAQGGLTGLLQYSGFGWPFFSIVVAHIHQITQLSFELSAIVLNTLLFVILTDSLVLLSNKILPNTRQIALAALFFLCFLTLNEYRAFLGRDVGYWAFCSLALYQFILYLEKPSIQKATLWQLAMITAILFRIDGVVILLGLPLYLFAIQSPKYAFKQSLQLFYLLIIGIVIAAFIAIDQSNLSSIFSKLASITKYVNPDSVLSKFNHNTELIETQILNKFSEKFSALILSSGLIIMLIYKLIKAITIGYIGIYIISCWQQTRLNRPSYRYLIGYFLALNIIILVGFMFTEYFVSKRYTLLAVISLVFLMLPRMCGTLEKAWSSRNKPILVIAGIILFVSLIDGVTRSNSKVHIKDVAIWASNNLPENSTVFTDNSIIKYYFNSHQPVAKLSIAQNIYNYQHYEYFDSYQDYDYLIVIEKPRYKELSKLLSTMNLEPVFKQENKRGSKTTVYAVHPSQ